MEAISSSVLPSRLKESSSVLQSSSSIKTTVHRNGFFKITENFETGRIGTAELQPWNGLICRNNGFPVVVSCELNAERFKSSCFRARSVRPEFSGAGREEGTSEIDHDLMPEEGACFDSNSSPWQSGEQGDDENPMIVTPLVGGTSGGSRAGLFRTPISGGVQSATSAHGLPRPALAVRNLMEQARFAHLCTVMSRMHHRRKGYPFGSLVDFATDAMGHPIFSFSPLAIHTRNLLADSRCTLVVQIPGWSGLSNARVTLFGDVFPLPDYKQEWAHKQYIAKHQQGASQQWGNFYYYRMECISDIYFIGGFGTVAWVDVKEYETLQPDKITVKEGEQNLKELNAMFSKPLKELLSTETEIDDAALISIDSKGTDIRVRQGAQFNIQRLSFEAGHEVETLDEAKEALQKLVNKGSRLRL